MFKDDLDSPISVAYKHISELLCHFPAGLIDEETLRSLSEVNKTWPVWPTQSLSNLVGPPNVILANLDLRWLHRFEASVLLLNKLSGMLGGPIGGPSGLSLIVERAPLLGHQGWGATSAGGSCRLVKAKDKTIAINLPREEDFLTIPAWLEIAPEEASWETINKKVSSKLAKDLITRAVLLGMAVSIVGEADHQNNLLSDFKQQDRLLEKPVVVDLTSMWAGPLCGWYLSRTGAKVYKVESLRRPDRGQKKKAPFYNRLNNGKKLIEVDFQSPEGIHQLTKIVREADIIVESSRPRALESLGIFAEEEVQRGAIWCSITGYGRKQNPMRIGFGDDAAAAGSLLASVDDSLWFVGDAIADPITGTTAAIFTMGLWATGTSGLIDVSLAGSVNAHTLGKIPKGIRK